LLDAAQHQESKIKYQQATQPKPEYKTPKGETKQIKADAPQVKTVRTYVTHERYVTYENRSTVFYGPGIYAHPYYYNDWYSPFLMGYMFSSAVNAQDRAYWMYCHQADMDAARYRDMLAKDAELEARIRQLEREKAVRDANYVIPSMKDNADLQYNKEFIDATYNPVEVPHSAPVHHESSGDGSGFATFLLVLLVLGILGVVVYFLFLKDYNG
jgi:hypothetical protein